MKLLKISYIDEIFNDCDYVKYPDNLFFKIGWEIIVKNDGMLKIASIVNIENIEEEDIEVTTIFIRVASKKDREQHNKNKKDSVEALTFAQELSLKLNLDMHLIFSFYTFDRKQLFLSYTASARVDFRELAKVLAQRYKTRIELRQIGVRDKAKMIGGIGPCGLFLCCSTFLTEFASVSINMAKNQFLALNPAKINGSCGRLLCCLNYEDEVYTELKKGMPNIGSLVETKEGLGKVIEVDVFKRTYKAEFKDKGVIEFSVNE